MYLVKCKAFSSSAQGNGNMCVRVADDLKLFDILSERAPLRECEDRGFRQWIARATLVTTAPRSRRHGFRLPDW